MRRDPVGSAARSLPWIRSPSGTHGLSGQKPDEEEKVGQKYKGLLFRTKAQKILLKRGKKDRKHPAV